MARTNYKFEKRQKELAKKKKKDEKKKRKLAKKLEVDDFDPEVENDEDVPDQR